MRSFVDKLADKTRLRRARHKGGYVPAKLKKIQVEYFDEDQEAARDDENPDKIPETMSDDEGDLGAAIGDNPTDNIKKKTFSEDTEQKMNRRTVEMYDLMLKTGTKVKAYSRQDEDKLKASIKLKKLGLNSITELDE